MIRQLTHAAMALTLTLTAAAGGAEPDRLRVRGDAWQRALDGGGRFRFDPERATALHALPHFRAKAQVHLVYDPAKPHDITFKFVRDGAETLSIKGHTGSAFCAAGNVLYFAHFRSGAHGCTVTAHALDTGERLWSTAMTALDAPAHSLYANRVTMTLSRHDAAEQDGEGVVRITGHESSGDYVEILDQATGKVLARRVYREGYRKQPHPARRGPGPASR